MGKYTPGPWLVEERASYEAFYRVSGPIDGEPDGYRVAHVIDANDYSCNDANARLIAAAPELLEALMHFAALPLEEFDLDRREDDRPITGFNNWDLKVGHIRAARAAIAKATGEQP